MKGFHVKQLLAGIEKALYLAGLNLSNCEITLEANPGAADYEDLSGFFDAGVNRLSIGAQSFNSKHLEVLGRIHSPRNIYEAHQAAVLAGFKRINLDLMFGLPDQSLEELEADLTQVLSLDTDHLSLYQLTIEPNTYFHRYPPGKLPNSDKLWKLSQYINEKAQYSGFSQYEVSAFSKGDESRSSHNLNYWLFGDYLGIGAGAHGKLSTTPSAGDKLPIKRYTKHKLPRDYMREGQPYTKKTTTVNTDDRILEFLMNGLRLNGGFPVLLFEQRTGQKSKNLFRLIDPLISEGLLTLTDDNRIKASQLGFNHLDDLLARCLS